VDIKTHYNEVTITDMVEGEEVYVVLTLDFDNGRKTRKELIAEAKQAYAAALDAVLPRYRKLVAHYPDRNHAQWLRELLRWHLSAHNYCGTDGMYLVQDQSVHNQEKKCYYRLSACFYNNYLTVEIRTHSSATVRYLFNTVEDAMDAWLKFKTGELNLENFYTVERIQMDVDDHTKYVSDDYSLSAILKLQLVNLDALGNSGG